MRNGGPSFRICLSSVSSCIPPAREIIVVDDASSDESAAMAEAVGARVLRLPQQRGPAHARNRGAALASGEVLLFVDADVAVPQDATAQVVDTLAREPHVAAVFGSYDDAPAETNLLSQYKNLLHHWVHQSSSPEASTFWAGCGAIRRSTFADLGGFDESYARPSIEDIELGMRVRARGDAIRLRKSLQAKHLKHWTAASVLRADIRDRALPWTALLLRRGELLDDLNLRWSARICGAVALLLLAALIGGWWWPMAWAIAAGLALLLLALNAPLYAFFLRRGGVRFAAAGVFWHWTYYLYSSLAFALGTLLHFVRGRPVRKQPGATGKTKP